MGIIYIVEDDANIRKLVCYALEKEGKLKHYNFSGSMIQDNTDTPEDDIERIVKEAKEHLARK